MKKSTELVRVVFRVHSFRCGEIRWEDLSPAEKKLATSYRLLEIKQAWWRDRVRRFGL